MGDGVAVAVQGGCDARFAAVRDAFAANFAEHGEVGAAVCVSVAGRTVVDLWAGVADVATGAPWQRDTLVNAFSVGKGLLALVAAQLVDRGQLDVDAPVASYWPEFAAAGKAEVTVADLLAHRAGLPALHERLPDEAMYHWRLMTAALAAETPWWEPGTAHGYHVNTYGYLVGEVLRRITGAMPGALLRDLVAGPLGVADEIVLGVPAALHARVAAFEWPAGVLPPEPQGDLSEDLRMRFHAYFNPRGLSGFGVINTPAWREAQIPSTNTHADARGVARVYAALAAGGAIDGARLLSPGSLHDATIERSNGHDLVLDRPSRFGLGFQLTQPERPLGPNPRSFGHFGAGGSLGFCDPDAGVGFGYVMNQLGERWKNPRNTALVDAVYASLG